MKFIISFIAILFCGVFSIASYPNKKLIITDMLDDDIRALVHLLSNSDTRMTIQAIVTSTGNTQLKAFVAQKIVEGFGLNIPVYAGTSSDLTLSPITQFAGRYEKEGYPIITLREMNTLKKLRNQSGNAVLKLAEIFSKNPSGSRIDILLLTAPTDLIKAIRLAPELAKMALGDLFAMGLYKKNGRGEFVAPYNTMADPQSVVQLFELYQQNYFQRMIHVASDVVQNSSGLPYGYVPPDEDRHGFNKQIKSAMSKNKVLNRILISAEEYGLNWRDQAVNQFGPGIGNDLDRWVPSSFTNPEHSARFYLADLIPSILSSQTNEKLMQQSFEHHYIETPEVNIEQIQTFNFYENKDKKLRPVLDLNKFDGTSALKEHISLIEKIPRINIDSNDKNQLSQDDKFDYPQIQNSAYSSSRKKNGLVVIFKNSPDDWFALLRLISVQGGVTSLRNGGIICEGFNSEQMALNVKAFMKSFGLGNISVGAGSNYDNHEVDNIPNFKLERAIVEKNQDGRAFHDLVVQTQTVKSELKSVSDILEETNHWAHLQHRKFDLLVLGEGIDFFTFLDISPQAKEQVGDLYVMGGGRIDPNSQNLILSRNWLPHKDKVIGALDQLGENGKKIFIFSSNEFGGSIVSTAGARSGNGTVVFSKLAKEGESNLAIRSVYDHWINWSRVFSWVIGDSGLTPFDSNSEVQVATISPLGLFIADEWISGQLAAGESSIEIQKVSLEAKLSGNQDPDNLKSVSWLKRNSGQEITNLAKRFGTSIGRLARNTSSQVFDSAVRETSVFSENVQNAFEQINSKNKLCLKVLRK